MTATDRLLTAKEIADQIGVNSRTLDNWRIAGTGPRFIKIGANVRYRESDFQDWLESRAVLSTAEARSLR